MCQRHIAPGDDRTAQDGKTDGRCDELILQPGVFIVLIVDDLTQVDRVKVNTLIVIAHDRACAPIRMTCAVFILQANEQQDVLKPSGFDNLGNKFDRAVAVAGASPNDLAGGSLDRQE